MKLIKVLDYDINKEEYISLTDIAKKKNPNNPKDVVKNWMRTRFSIEFLGLWEKINNSNFKGVEIDPLLIESGKNHFTMSPTKWISLTNAIGIELKLGKNAGTYAHKDIALEFASWISVEFKLYLIKEFQRLKKIEAKTNSIEWDIKRILTKINYKIHTDSIKENLIPKKISINSKLIYSNEADLLNLALFNKTAKEWKDKNKGKKGNIRDYSNIEQLVILSNLENLNSEFIRLNFNKEERLNKLNMIAIKQMKSLLKNSSIKKFK